MKDLKVKVVNFQGHTSRQTNRYEEASAFLALQKATKTQSNLRKNYHWRFLDDSGSEICGPTRALAPSISGF
jgi:hypothetical protein